MRKNLPTDFQLSRMSDLLRISERCRGYVLTNRTNMKPISKNFFSHLLPSCEGTLANDQTYRELSRKTILNFSSESALTLTIAGSTVLRISATFAGASQTSKSLMSATRKMIISNISDDGGIFSTRRSSVPKEWTATHETFSAGKQSWRRREPTILKSQSRLDFVVAEKGSFVANIRIGYNAQLASQEDPRIQNTLRLTVRCHVRDSRGGNERSSTGRNEVN